MSDTRFKKGRIPHNKIGATRDCTFCGLNFSVKGQRKYRENISCSQSCAARLRIKLHGAPMTGVKMSEDSKEKMRQAKLGFRGDKHWNWRPWTKQSRRDRVYFRDTMQKKIFERDGYKCVLCKVGGNLQVDHIQRWSEHPELRFEASNCRTLCAPCHYKITFNRDMPESVKAWGHNLSQRIAS